MGLCANPLPYPRRPLCVRAVARREIRQALFACVTVALWFQGILFMYSYDTYSIVIHLSNCTHPPRHARVMITVT